MAKIVLLGSDFANHNYSFMIPGFIGAGVSTTVAYLLAKLAFRF